MKPRRINGHRSNTHAMKDHLHIYFLQQINIRPSRYFLLLSILIYFFFPIAYHWFIVNI
uniref:Uncharacterized protein n=1 Tax=Manihot esculenta TaxID=3983 RepID=A0A2C9VY38_MANES